MRDFKKESLIHSETLGFDLSALEQGTDNWHKARAGVITASKAHLLLMGQKTLGRLSYIDKLLASVATGLCPDEIKAAPLQWGKDHEDDARDAYSATTFETVTDQGFIYMNDSMRAGCSPDGLIEGKAKGLELKCPWSSSVFMGFAGRGYIKKEEVAQVQFSLMITDFDTWGFAKYDPRVVNCKKLYMIEVERDEKIIANLRDGLEMLIEDMDCALERLGMGFGQQWQQKVKG
jgi:hypothetical protein